MIFTGTLTKQEREEYDAWKEERIGNGELADFILDRKNFANNEEVVNRFDRRAGWKEFRRRLSIGGGKVVSLRDRRKRLYRMGYVAAVSVLLAVGIAWWQMAEVQSPTSGAVSEFAYRIKAGGTGAQVVLSNGRTVEINENQTFLYKETDSTFVLTDSTGASYATFPADGNEGQLNTIRTLTGMEYTLTLSDGTVVYLNAESEVRFPTVFADNQRVVELSGEAYFEVARNAASPFVVKTRDLSVKVLGTSFNVRAYEDEREVETTLAEGKVQVFDGQKFVDLKPGEQVVYEKANRKMTVNLVELGQCMAWRNGRFIFRNERLEDIILYLARWYHVKYQFMDEQIKNVRIGAKLDRYADMNPIVEMLKVNSTVSVSFVDGVYYIGSK